MSLSEVLPTDYSVDTVPELTYRSATGTASEGFAHGPTWPLE